MKKINHIINKVCYICKKRFYNAENSSKNVFKNIKKSKGIVTILGNIEVQHINL